MQTVSIDDSFFDLGGHSLLAARLAARASTALGLNLTIADVFHSPTPVALIQRKSNGTRRPELVAGRRPETVPLSYAQHRLWFLNKLEGPSATYNVPLSVRLRGELNVEALRAAFGDVVRRHEVLRTVFDSSEGEPCQRVLEDDQVVFACQRVDAVSLDGELRAAAGHLFDIATEPPIRVALFDVDGRDECVLLVLLHHIATDGLSVRPLFADLATAYAARVGGKAPDWAALPVQYADYALWQREMLGDESNPDSAFAKELAFWRERLAGLPEELGLPFDRPRPVVAGHRGGAVVVQWDEELHRRLVELARAEKCTLFMVLQAALAVTLARFGAGDDVPIGSPVAGRSDDALDDMVGFFVNMLVLRTDVSGDPAFRELLARVRAADLEAYAHQDMPFDRLLEALNPVRSLSRHPLFQVCLALESGAGAELKLPGVQAEPGSIVDTGSAKFDLELLLREDAGSGITGAVLYSAEIFDHPTVERIVGALRSVLEQIAADPGVTVGAVDVLGADRGLVVEGWNATVVDVVDGSLGELFEARVAAVPDAVALVFG
ncbi:condensation domain-containing protein, partial [Allorhizocola rhizosphaerae]|uniref:condensation domain-containing protein n=1 Tax=Allorhizocola rhizosphaerae TaxID=1872709 RepID=UPI001FE9310B